MIIQCSVVVINALKTLSKLPTKTEQFSHHQGRSYCNAKLFYGLESIRLRLSLQRMNVNECTVPEVTTVSADTSKDQDLMSVYTSNLPPNPPPNTRRPLYS